MSQDVELDNVTMRFGDFTAVRNINLTVRAGEFFSFLGPSGCGKTTILRILSGFTEPTEGHVRIGGVDMAGKGPNERPTALIFQNLALFPLMSVWENIAFGLEVRGVPRDKRRKRAMELLELIAMPDAADKRISELSGGMKQRVAIARALAVEPKVMLLDEPLSALDLKLRQHMRSELRAIQRRTGVTFIYITHDQGEALTMSDRVAVMSRGRIEQVGPSSEIYDAPQTPFVATFVGENNRFSGRVADIAGGVARIETAAGLLSGRAGPALKAGDKATLFVRPERLRMGADEANRLSARIHHVDFEGSFANLFLNGAADGEIIVQAANDGALPSLAPGVELALGFAPESAVVLPTGGDAGTGAGSGEMQHAAAEVAA
ncbi:spermidine/putrescine import ATP-binding protein PotA [Alsobacter metallidurans]|uniref:Spermidine/putrescine import ATP-binding protein PotA n=1 Tax=Alsobacter metallidurans TaxID=340221 RepID=A0A917IAX7_9HYPH|nr:ABC transporter ATP-binding protein [Alsobacter metallidurans]GGH33857.1 spermidine/putrescine import ATP-binding protein PotA [Alsobacter metallidurans]